MDASAADERCPFNEDAERRAIWRMLVTRDIDAFVAGDWRLVAEDFLAEEFFGVDARKSAQVDEWTPSFSSLGAYRDEWLRQSRETAAITDPARLKPALLALTDLSRIDIDGDLAVAHKKFDGEIVRRDGGAEALRWQTLYFCKRVAGRWRIRGFLGYLPYAGRTPSSSAKSVPSSRQHVTAGPYSPVVSVAPGAELIVISGQAPLDMQGCVIGEDVEAQARVTLENCRTQLAAAGVGFADVFKVNVYMTDLSLWGRFNAVYREYVPEPYPARTAIQCGLLPGMIVEIDMWAARR